MFTERCLDTSLVSTHYMLVAPCYRLNVCVPPKFICWYLNPQGDTISRWDPWKVVRSWEQRLMNGNNILIKAMVFPIVMYGCESWTIKKAEPQRIDAFKLWCWRRLLRVPWNARRLNQSILQEINLEYSLEGLLLKLKLQSFGHLMWRANSLEKILMLGKRASPGGSVVKNLPANAGEHEMRVWSLCHEDPWRRAWQPTPVFLPEEFHGQRSP